MYRLSRIGLYDIDDKDGWYLRDEIKRLNAAIEEICRRLLNKPLRWIRSRMSVKQEMHFITIEDGAAKAEQVKSQGKW